MKNYRFSVERTGFSPSRQSGSHMIFKNDVGSRVAVPFHGDRTLNPKLLKSILNEANLTPDEFVNLLK